MAINPTIIEKKLGLLANNTIKLNEWGKGFVKSVMKQFADKGSLSSNQIYWVDKLVEELKDDVPKLKTVRVGNFEKVYSLIGKVAGKLKHPAIRFSINGEDMTLYLAGNKSKFPGILNLVGTGRRWYGRLNEDGTWNRYEKLVDHLRAPTWDFLNALGKNPEETLAKHGRLTGRCCYCWRGLVDERSVEVGYGPVCAKRWGLPWGKK